MGLFSCISAGGCGRGGRKAGKRPHNGLEELPEDRQEAGQAQDPAADDVELEDKGVDAGGQDELQIKDAARAERPEDVVAQGQSGDKSGESPTAGEESAPQHLQDDAAAAAEAERLEAERLEAERLEAERLEAERLEAERLEAERLEAERLEAERLAAEARDRQAEAREREAMLAADAESRNMATFLPTMSVKARARRFAEGQSESHGDPAGGSFTKGMVIQDRSQRMEHLTSAVGKRDRGALMTAKQHEDKIWIHKNVANVKHF